MHHIFFSYRREDRPDTAGRIYHLLRDRFGKDAIFKDIDNMPTGLDWRVSLNKTLDRCTVLVAIIGPDWNADDRLVDPEDWVRQEIEIALEREIPVIPVLVGGAAHPRKEDLPKSMQKLVYRQGHSIAKDPHFEFDVGRLIRGIEPHLEDNDVPPVEGVKARAETIMWGKPKGERDRFARARVTREMQRNSLDESYQKSAAQIPKTPILKEASQPARETEQPVDRATSPESERERRPDSTTDAKPQARQGLIGRLRLIALALAVILILVFVVGQLTQRPILEKTPLPVLAKDASIACEYIGMLLADRTDVERAGSSLTIYHEFWARDIDGKTHLFVRTESDPSRAHFTNETREHALCIDR